MAVEKKLLVVEDDRTSRELLQSVLENAGYTVSAASDASSALTFLHQDGLPNLIVMDLGLPGMDGFSLCERIKRMGDVPIIIITGNRSDADKVRGISLYAEDYIVKPYNVPEVLARIQRILSRFNPPPVTGRLVRVDNHLQIDFANNMILVGGEEYSLTPIETALLHVLWRNTGQVITVDTLIARIWNSDVVEEENLRVHIHRLRHKLHSKDKVANKEEQRLYLHTERGIGYCFQPPGDAEYGVAPTT